METLPQLMLLACAAAGYIGVGVEHDLGGIARVVYGRKPLDSPTPVRTKSHA